MGRGVGKILSVVLILAVTLVAGIYFYDFLIRSINSASSLPIAYVNYTDLVQDNDIAYFTISIYLKLCNQANRITGEQRDQARMLLVIVI